MTSSALSAAVAKQRLAVVDYLLELGCPRPDASRGEKSLLNEAVESGSARLILGLLHRGEVPDAQSLVHAAKLPDSSHRRRLMRLLVRHGAPLSSELYARAVLQRDEEALQWLRQMGCPRDETTASSCCVT